MLRLLVTTITFCLKYCIEIFILLTIIKQHDGQMNQYNNFDKDDNCFALDVV